MKLNLCDLSMILYRLLVQGKRIPFEERWYHFSELVTSINFFFSFFVCNVSSIPIHHLKLLCDTMLGRYYQGITYGKGKYQEMVSFLRNNEFDEKLLFLLPCFPIHHSQRIYLCFNQLVMLRLMSYDSKLQNIHRKHKMDSCIQLIILFIFYAIARLIMP